MSRHPPSSLACAVLLLCGCSQVELQGSADAGTPQPLRVAEVQPSPGPVDRAAHFRVAFSAPMDASLLLADADHSETVVLVPAANVELVAAALAHGRLSARLRAALIAAHASLDSPGVALDLVPDQPLPAGEVWLLVASRLKDAQGRKLSGNGARFGFTVGAAPARPRLLAPRAGTAAPANLSRVRIELPQAGFPGTLSLQGPDGAVWSGAAPAGEARMTVQLCPEGADCAALRPSVEYALAADGEPVPGETFTAAECRQEAPPAVGPVTVVARDDSAFASAVLDAPALVRLEAAPAARAQRADDDAALAALCAQGGCTAAEGETSCVRQGCGPAGAAGSGSGAGSGADAGLAGSCPVELSVQGLRAGEDYLARVVASDDEGHRAVSRAIRFTTLSNLPHVAISEVMSWPPPPSPRTNGQYIELLNEGRAPADLAALALVGPDGRVRELDGGGGPQMLLAPGKRALAVGAAFDAARYPALPREVPILRATTQRPLGRALREQSPPPFALVQVRPGTEPVVLDSFPGGIHCSAGQSIERQAAGPGPQAPAFACGNVGGSPGVAP